MTPCHYLKNKKKYSKMEKIKVDVSWAENSFGASVGENVPGAVVATGKTFYELQKSVKEALEFHVECMLNDGDEIPEWLASGDYELYYNFLDAASLLHAYEPLVSLAAISRKSGINQSLLSHYANGMKKPRPAQRDRIVNSIHSIGRELLSVV